MLKKEKQLVSVIIPVYNRDRVILDTLKNIHQNEYRPIELILVDDGSTDNSLKILQKFKQDYNTESFKVEVFNQKNSGAPVARNLGYENSKGAFIQFLDSDDYIDKEKFNIQVRLMKYKDADFGLCDYEMLYKEDNKRVNHSNSEKLNKVLKTHGSFGCGSPLLRRSLADKVSWNIELNRKQDVDYFLKSALMSEKMSYVNKPLYTYVRSIEDDNRISASYAKTSPVFKKRISSLHAIDVPSHHKLHKTAAIFNLYVSIIKFEIKKIYEKTFFRHRHNRSSF